MWVSYGTVQIYLTWCSTGPMTSITYTRANDSSANHQDEWAKKHKLTPGRSATFISSITWLLS